MLTLTYYGHSCFLLDDGQYKVLFDPFLTGNPKAAIAAVDVDCDYILVSHAHSDHLGDAPEIAARTGAAIVAIPEVLALCEESKPGLKQYPMNLGGSLTLVLLNLPMLVRVTEESIRTVPKSYEEASLALGATKLQTIFKVVLPSAMPGILTGITLTAGRALGETAILIFTAGTTVSRHMFDTDVMAGGETLAVHLWYLMSTGLVPDRDAIANGIGALLILTILVFNFVLLLPVKLLGSKTKA